MRGYQSVDILCKKADLLWSPDRRPVFSDFMGVEVPKSDYEVLVDTCQVRNSFAALMAVSHTQLHTKVYIHTYVCTYTC